MLYGVVYYVSLHIRVSCSRGACTVVLGDTQVPLGNVHV